MLASGERMKLGIAQYSADASGREFLEAATRLRLDGAEPFIPDAADAMLSRSQEELDALLSRAADLCVEIPSVAIGVFNNDPSLVLADGREKAIEVIQRCLRFTALLCARTMLLCAFVQSDPDTPEKRQNLLRVIGQVEPVARNLDIVLGLETPLPASETLSLLDSMQSPHVGVYYDIGNATFLGHDIGREIRALGSRIVGVHVKDCVRSFGDARLGHGKANLDAAMEALKDVGYDGWLILETPSGEAGLREDIRLIKRYMEEITDES